MTTSSNFASMRRRVEAAMVRSDEQEPATSSAYKIYDSFIDRDLLASQIPLDNGSKTFKKPRATTQGRLQTLPIELYHACLQHLDMATLTAMRHVSRFSRDAIDSLHPYKEIYEYAPQGIRVCLAMGSAPHVPLLRLHQALSSMECYYCKKSNPSKLHFGTYLSAYECRRACLFCLRNNEELTPIEFTTLTSLICHRNTSLRGMTDVRLLKTIPDKYGPARVPTTTTLLLLSRSVVPAPGKSLTENEQRTLFGNNRSATIYYHPLTPPTSQSDISEDSRFVAPDAAKKAIQTYMTAVKFPYLTTASKDSDYGTSCRNCYLHMVYHEDVWVKEQRARHHPLQMAPSASLRRKNLINGAREKGCIRYTTSKAALQDQKNLDLTTVETNKPWTAMSIQEHAATHKDDKLGLREQAFRARMEARRKPVPSPEGNST